MNGIDLERTVEGAYQRIRGDLSLTPLEQAMDLSSATGVKTFLKHEEMQYTGSFKLRGALSKISSLSRAELVRGVVTASTGNHGMGVAFASKYYGRYGTRATVFLPQATDHHKKERILAMGAVIEEVSGDCLAAELEARASSEKSGQVFISPYNDPAVIAGQGTIALEMLEQCQKLDAVFVTVGGGGLISGIAGYLKAKSPDTKIYGCWPENARSMYECMKAGKIVSFEEKPTLSTSSAGGPEPGSITFECCRRWIDETVLVDESEIHDAVRLIARSEHCMIEGAAGVAVAAFQKSASALRGKTVAIVLCGRNISADEFARLIQNAHVR